MSPTQTTQYQPPKNPGPRSHEALAWAARLGYVEVGAMATAMGWAGTTVRSHVRRLVKAGLVVRDHQLFRGVMLAVSPEGMRTAGQVAEAAPKVPLSPSVVNHKREISWVAAWLEALGHDWISEREMAASRAAGSDSWTVDLGEGTHIPDVGLRLGERRRAAIEVELSQKSNSRLRAIAKGYAAQVPDGLEQVTYVYAHHAIAVGVYRAFAKADAQDTLALISVEDMRRRALSARRASPCSQGPSLEELKERSELDLLSWSDAR